MKHFIRLFRDSMYSVEKYGDSCDCHPETCSHHKGRKTETIIVTKTEKMVTNPADEGKNITIDEFLQITDKLDIRYGQILVAERVPKSKKLISLLVIFGETRSDEKTIVTNIGDKFSPEELIGLVLPFIINFPTTNIMGIDSEGMIILPSYDGLPQIENFRIGSKLF